MIGLGSCFFIYWNALRSACWIGPWFIFDIPFALVLAQHKAPIFTSQKFSNNRQTILIITALLFILDQNWRKLSKEHFKILIKDWEKLRKVITGFMGLLEAARVFQRVSPILKLEEVMMQPTRLVSFQS